MVGIYKITSLRDGRVYIGSSVDIQKRIKSHKWHLKRQSHRNRHLQAVYNKYGESNLDFCHLEECDVGELRSLEMEYINGYDSYNNGFNLTKDTIAPMRGIALTEEHKSKIGLSNKGRRGHVMSDETKEKIRQYQLSRPRRRLSDAHKKSLSLAHTGKKQSAATVEKRRQKMMLIINTPEYREKLSESVRKSWARRRLKNV
jgi:group I intron endonuclease